MQDDYIIDIDSVKDIPIALDLIAAQPDRHYALKMALKPEQRFTAVLWYRKEVRPVTITHAYCAAIPHNDGWICHALNESEGYFVENHEFLNGAFIHFNQSRPVVEAALVRFFSLADYEDQHADPVTRTVVPAFILDRR